MTDEITMRTSFVILTWNRGAMLPVCLEALYRSINDKKQSEIIIFNNASTDNTPSILAAFKEKYQDNITIRVVNNATNLGLNAYKQLMPMAKGDYIIEVDDDVLEFPDAVDDVFVKYLNTFKKFGFLCLDVVKNEHTNGAKPPEDQYHDFSVDGLTVQIGPTGGWCAGFRKKDYRIISFIFEKFTKLGFNNGEDAVISRYFRRLGKKSGVIKDVKCFHAVGPYYAKQYGSLDRDIEKYETAGITYLSDEYKNHR